MCILVRHGHDLVHLAFEILALKFLDINGRCVYLLAVLVMVTASLVIVLFADDDDDDGGANDGVQTMMMTMQTLTTMM